MNEDQQVVLDELKKKGKEYMPFRAMQVFYEGCDPAVWESVTALNDKQQLEVIAEFAKWGLHQPTA